MFYIAAGLAGLLMLGNLFTYPLQDIFIFRPRKLPPDYRYVFEVPFEEVNLTTAGGGRLNGLLFRCPDRDKARGVVLYFHGNTANLQRWGNLYQFFFRHRHDFFVFDYRGFGKSRGRRTESLLFQDAEAAYWYTRRFYPSGKIVIFGRSMGSAFACRLAADQPARALILETPFSAMNDLFYIYYPFLPKLFLFKYRFLNRRYLAKVSCPVYIFQGTADKVVPERCASRLRPFLKPADRYIKIDGGRHSDLMIYEIYQRQMAEILGTDWFSMPSGK